MSAAAAYPLGHLRMSSDPLRGFVPKDPVGMFRFPGTGADGPHGHRTAAAAFRDWTVREVEVRRRLPIPGSGSRPQPVSTANPTMLRSARLNSTPIR